MSQQSQRSQQHAFVCILKDYNLIELLILALVEHGIFGATLIDSRGMGQILCQDLPLFVHLRDRFPGSDNDSHILLSIVSEDELDLCFELAERIAAPQASGLIFSIPVGRAIHLGAHQASEEE